MKENIKLFLVSFAMLFLEIALIRWISTEIRIFAYVNNLVLLSCFLGIGLGCYFSRKPEKKFNLSVTILTLSVLILLVEAPLTIRNIYNQNIHIHIFRDIPIMLGGFSDSVIWSEPHYNLLGIVGGVAATFIIFFIILFTFVPLGQILGRLLHEHKNIIVAYSINVLASIFGIWCFNMLSFLYAPPWAWFLLGTVSIVIVLLFTPRSPINLFLGFMCLLFIPAMFFWSKPDKESQIIWSPYQKLEVHPYTNKNLDQGYLLRVNNVPYIALLDLSDDFIMRYPEYFDYNMRMVSQYDIQYMLKRDIKKVLIVGAGAGNDAAGALRNGAENIDAVEIDPGIYKLGLKLHPEHPYSDPKVNVIIDDARSFFKKSKHKYDLISFGLLDAHTLSSSYTNMRLDHYVYTEESFREAKNLLEKDGLFTVVFWVKRPWIGGRINDLLQKVFGTPPLTFGTPPLTFGTPPLTFGTPPLTPLIRGSGWEGRMFVASNDMDNIMSNIHKDFRLKEYIEKNKVTYPKKTKMTTDDWPYLYLEKAGIPKMHLCITLVLLLVFALTRHSWLPKGQKLDLHFFFLGAAFLLLEFQNISKTTLLFGSTWMVNSFIISAILLLILCANLFVSIFEVKDVKPIYFLLMLSILIIYLIPLRVFNFLDYWPRSILVSIILNLPIFFAGIIFISSFKNTEQKDLAFGSNLIGAAAGGMLESISFIVGINALLLIVMALYFSSFIFMKKQTVHFAW